MATEAIFEIKTHEESFTDIEILLRRELESHLPEDLREYTTDVDLKNLKEYRATADTFHPENHFYAFDGDEFVGFIHLWPQYSGENNEKVDEVATISLPFVRSGYDAVESQLLSTVVNRAKSLGVTTLQLSIDTRHSEGIEHASRLGFDYHGLNRLFARTEVNSLDISPVEAVKVTDFNRENHGEAVLDLYESLGIDRQQIINQFDWIEDMKDRILSWKVAIDDEKVVGHSIAFVYENNEDRAQMNVVTRSKDLDDNEYQKVVRDVYATHLKALKSRNVEEVDLNILSSVLDLRPIYESLGFEFIQSNAYRKDVS